MRYIERELCEQKVIGAWNQRVAEKSVDIEGRNYLCDG